MMINKKVVAIAVMILSCSTAMAQRASVSVDALKWATLTPNISVEVLLSEHITASIETTINPFNDLFDRYSTKQVTISPELRYYFKRPNYSHFVGINAVGSIYDVGFNGDYYNGRMAAVGVVYGYSFYLSERWSATPSIGVGYGYFKYNEFTWGVKQPIESGFKPTITKFGLSFTYLID